MNSSLEYVAVKMAACTLGGRVSANPNGDCIEGRWGATERIYRLHVTGKMLQEFVNEHQILGRILAFTRKFGVLTQEARRNSGFTFPIQEWIDCQQRICKIWRRLAGGKGQPIHYWLGPSLDFSEGDAIRVHDGTVTIKVKTLARLLELSLYLRPRNSIRICLRPDCTTPYFLAKDLRQHYCSDVCSKWAQLKVKRESWARRAQKDRSQGVHSSDARSRGDAAERQRRR